MSSVIEQKILEMRFDNKQFEDNVSESISTLDKLKSALNFDKMADSFGTVSAAAGKVDFSPISEGVEKVIVKFNALEVAAVQAVANIIENGINKLQSVINDLSIDQVTAGWEKYEEKTTSVQTIMNATGKSIEEVSAQLERLNWFSDETSYGFTDMTSNVGKFTSVGIELEDAVTAMEGIATWAALAGKNSQEASRAMYNMSQAMAIGAVKTLDWRSIESLNMNTNEFKQIAMETAASLGTLREFADGTFQTIDKGTNVTIKDFNSALSEGWFTSEVLMKTLEHFGGYANELSKACEETEISATKLHAAIEDYASGARDMDQILKDTGADAETLIPWIEKLSGAEYELGRQAFLASQQSKTLTDALDATRDAISTQWMQTFEYLFGNYEEAADFFTKITEHLWNIFATSGEVRNDILEQWAEVGGGKTFREGFLNVFEGVSNIVDHIRTSLLYIFGIWRNFGDNGDGTFFSVASKEEIFTNKLVEWTKSFNDFSKSFVKFTEDIDLDPITGVLSSFFETLTNVFSILFNAAKSLKPVFEWLGGSLDYLFRKPLTYIMDSLSTWSRALKDFIKENDIFGKTVEKVMNFVSKAYGDIKDVLSPLTDKLSPFIDQVKNLFRGSNYEQYTAFYQTLEKIRDKFSELTGTGSKFREVLNKIEEKFSGLKTVIENVVRSVSDFFSTHNLSTGLTDIWNLLKNIGNTLWDIASFAGSKFLDFGKDVGNTFKEMFSGIRQAFKDYKIEDVFSSIGTGLSGTIKNLGSADLSGFLGNLGKGALALGGFNLAKLFGTANKGLETLTGNTSGGGIGEAIKGLISPVTDVFDQLKETLGSFTKDTDADKLKAIAAGVGILTIALVVMSGIDSDKMAVALEGLAGVLGGMFLEMKGLASMDFTKSGKQMKNIGLGMVEMAAAALIMVEAVKPFADMDGDKLAKSLGAMTVILTEFGLFIAAFGAISRANSSTNTHNKGIFGLFYDNEKGIGSNGFDKQLKNVGLAMIELGAAMKIFASAVKDFDDVNGLKRSIGAMTIVMTEMGLFIFAVSRLDTKGITAAGFAMIELGAAMKIFASAMRSLDSIGNILQSIEGMTAIVAAMVAFMLVADAFSKESGQIVVIASAMVILGIAMNSFAHALSDLSDIEYEPMRNAIAALIAVGLEMAGFMIIAGKMAKKSGEITVIAAAMIVLGIAMQTFAKAMDMFAENEPNEWFNAIVQMAACFGEMLIFIAVANAVAENAPQIAIISASMILLGLGMQAFAAAAKGFAEVQWESLGKAGAVIGGLVVAVGALAAIGTVAGVGLATVATSLLAIGGAIALIGVGIAALNLGTFVGQLGQISQRLIFLTDNLVAMVKAMEINAVIDAIVAALLALPKVITGVITGIITGIISGLGQILGSLGMLLEGAKTAILEFLKFAEAVVPAIIDSFLTIIIESLGSVVEKAPEILVLFGDLILKVLDALIEYIPQIVKKLSTLFILVLQNLKTYIPEIVVSFLDFMGALFQSIIDVVKNTEQDTLEKMAEIFAGFIGVIAILNLIGPMILPAMGYVVLLAAFVAEVGLLVAAFGALEKIEGLKSLVEGGGELLEAIGTAIGKFVGGIIGGFMEGATDVLPKIGKNISDFWTNVKPFIDGVGNIGMDTVEKVGILSGAILLLTAADFIQGITDFIRDATKADEFGTSVSKMWKNIQPFVDGVKTLEPNVVDSVESLSKAILILTAAQLIDGITSFIIGKTDIEKFGTTISELGPYLKNFSDSVKDINTEAVKTASESIKLLAETFDTNVFKTGGIVQLFKGENDLIEFGNGLVSLGPLIMEYAKSVEGMPVDVIENSVKGATALTEMAKTVPPSGGILQAMTGKRDLVEFARGLALLGPSMVVYAKSVSGLDRYVVQNSIICAQALSGFAENLEEKSLVDRIFGKDKMKDFCESLTTLGTSMKTFFDDIKGIKPAYIDDVMRSITNMMDMFSDDNDKNFKVGKSFANELQKAVNDGITKFIETIDENLPTVLNEGTEMITSFMIGIEGQRNNLIALINKLISDILSRFSSNFTTFKRYGTNLMASFNSGLASVMGSIDATIGNVIQKMKDQLSAASLLNWFKTAGKNLMIQMSEGILQSADTVMLSVSMMGQAALGQLTNSELLTSFSTAGSNVGASFASGLQAQQQNVLAAAGNLSAGAQQVVSSGLSDLQQRIDRMMDEVNYTPTITPVIDMTNADAALKDLEERFNKLSLDIDTKDIPDPDNNPPAGDTVNNNGGNTIIYGGVSVNIPPGLSGAAAETYAQQYLMRLRSTGGTGVGTYSNMLI